MISAIPRRRTRLFPRRLSFPALLCWGGVQTQAESRSKKPSHAAHCAKGLLEHTLRLLPRGLQARFAELEFPAEVEHGSHVAVLAVWRRVDGEVIAAFGCP